MSFIMFLIQQYQMSSDPHGPIFLRKVIGGHSGFETTGKRHQSAFSVPRKGLVSDKTRKYLRVMYSVGRCVHVVAVDRDQLVLGTSKQYSPSSVGPEVEAALTSAQFLGKE